MDPEHVAATLLLLADMRIQIGDQARMIGALQAENMELRAQLPTEQPADFA